MLRKASGKTLNVRRIVNLARDERRRSDVPARLMLVGSGRVLRTLAAAVAEQAGAPGPVDVIDLGAGTLHLGLRRDDVVLVCADGLAPRQLQAALSQAHDVRAGLVVALSSEDAGAAARAALAAGALSTELEVYEPGLPLECSRLAGAVADAAGDRGMALAAAAAWLRPAVVARLIRRAAAENALIGALVFIPGADMPVMTLNQVRMVLRIAASYGRGVEPARAPEVLAVVGAGLGLRALAHQGLKFVPAAGWALKGAVGYAGTVALGRAAAAYYQSAAAGALGAVEVELPEALERRLPAPLAGLVRERLGAGRLSAPATGAAVARSQGVTNEVLNEPLTGMHEHADHREGGLSRGG